MRFNRHTSKCWE